MTTQQRPYTFILDYFIYRSSIGKSQYFLNIINIRNRTGRISKITYNIFPTCSACNKYKTQLSIFNYFNLR